MAEYEVVREVQNLCGILGMAGTPARQSLVMRIFWLTPPQTT